MPSPVKHTCPDIDKAIKHIRQALKAALDGKKITERHSDEYSCFDTIEDELWCLEDKLEDLRSDNDHLRKWGHECEDRIHELEKEVSDLDEKISIIS